MECTGMNLASVNWICGMLRLCRVHPKRFISWGVLFAVSTIPLGCKARNAPEEEIDRAFAIAVLEEAERSPVPEYRERAKSALMELNNDVMTSKPVTVAAILAFRDPNRLVLAITCLDEDRNLHGIRVREQRETVGGPVVALEEDYPVFPAFADQLMSSTVERRLISVRIREEHRRKDELLWLRYENDISNVLIREAIEKAGRTASDVSAHELPPSDMPPIYISVPDPNRVRVQISVYDRAGQASEWIGVHAGASMALRRSESDTLDEPMR